MMMRFSGGTDEKRIPFFLPNTFTRKYSHLSEEVQRKCRRRWERRLLVPFSANSSNCTLDSTAERRKRNKTPFTIYHHHYSFCTGKWGWLHTQRNQFALSSGESGTILLVSRIPLIGSISMFKVWITANSTGDFCEHKSNCRFPFTFSPQWCGDGFVMLLSCSGRRGLDSSFERSADRFLLVFDWLHRGNEHLLSRRDRGT